MGIRKLIKKAGRAAGNTISKLSVLSPDQLDKVIAQRQAYLEDRPDPADPLAIELTNRMLASAGIQVYSSYLPELQSVYTPVEFTAEFDDYNPASNIRYFNITKWVIDKKENNLEKLVNVYESLSGEPCNIALIFKRTLREVKIFLAVSNTVPESNNVRINNFVDRIQDTMKGNFPGAEFSKVKKGNVPVTDSDSNLSVASISALPAEKSEKYISQTIEKILDGIIPETKEEEYSIILLATPIADVEERRAVMTQLHSGLKPYSSWQTSYTNTESYGEGASAAAGINLGASFALQNSQISNTTRSNGVSNSNSTSNSVNASRQNSQSTSTSSSSTESSSQSQSSSTSKSTGSALNGQVGLFGTGAGASLSEGEANTTTSGQSSGVSSTLGQSAAQSTAQSIGRAVSNTLGRAVSNSVAVTQGLVSGVSKGLSAGASFTRTSNVTATVGKNEGIVQNFENYTIVHALKHLEKQIERFDTGSALGMWDFASYVISEDINMTNNIAHAYLALIQGKDSYLSTDAINIWRGDLGTRSGSAKEILKYLKNLQHPLFGLDFNLVGDNIDYVVFPPAVTPSAVLSSNELGYALNFPSRSLPGFPVIECTEFGRNIISFEEESDRTIELGNIFHMNKKENTPITLDLNSLSSHVFITGSTGTGKSNTIYEILEKADEQGVKFLVIEPAKGEYKNVFGQRPDVHVYGTNPHLTPLLKLNPFSFNKDIHVLEHIERLSDLFNVAWPMYAAMPAVLKQAIEKSYEDCGWNLVTSENEMDDRLFPSFRDVERNILEIINSSEYDAENKGAYKGSLLTRLHSLTTGLYRLIFTEEEIPGEVLFDENTILDLSRIGSSETRALLMGIILLKLQEYRASTCKDMNLPLKHLTVLEEAHQLLKKTSTEQHQESSNLAGKSVEMLAGTIAEMRTYGEGFIIADQAPGLLDPSVIRNTNTKIIMRLPDLQDRQLVGYSANLSEEQILELARLPKGVGAIYQNNWIQPVLCQVTRSASSPQIYRQPQSDLLKSQSIFDETFSTIAYLLKHYPLLEKRAVDLGFYEPIDLHQAILNLKVSSRAKVKAMQILQAKTMEETAILWSDFIKACLDGELDLKKNLASDFEIAQNFEVLKRQLAEPLKSFSPDLMEQTILSLLEDFYCSELKQPAVFREWKEKHEFQ